MQVAAWDRVHPKLAKVGGWARHPGKIPLIEGTLIQLRPARLPGYRELKPMWLWATVTGAGEPEITVLWQAYLRRFDLEHTFRFFKQVLGWDAPLLRDPAAADRWTWLIIAATPSCGSPARSPRTCGCPGSGPSRPAP